jgi:xylulose-5-phosphate/fructose-6-phosphate phosphoketolase
MKMKEDPHVLSPEELKAIHAYWRAANYLSAGQIYLLDNALLHEPLLKIYTNLYIA